MGATRIVTVWFPDWPVVAARCDPSRPAAVMRANRVVALTPAAARDGVAVGQRRRQAQQRCPDLEIVDDDAGRDVREFEPVVTRIAEIAPRLDVVEPGWVSLPARGPSRYFGGDTALADRLVALAARAAPDGPASPAATGDGTPRPVPVGVGVADGRFASAVAARLAARRRRPLVVATDRTVAFCAELPVGWLLTTGEADADLVDLLVRLGIRRLGDLAALPPPDVLGRFGPAGIHAHHLASGLDPRPATTTAPPPERRLDVTIDDPVERSDAVVFVAKQLADELAGRLAAEGRVCTRLVVQLETEHGERSERAWYRPSGLSATAMVERVRWQVDAWTARPRGAPDEITAGVALVRLLPEEVRADHGDQLGLWGGRSDDDRRAARAIARLTTLTSESAVTVPVRCGGRLPHEGYRWVPAATVDLDRRAAAVTPVTPGGPVPPGGPVAPGGPVTPVAEGGPWPGTLPSPSPATVLAEPVPVEVRAADGAEVVVTGRGVLTAPPATLRWAERSWTVRAWAGPWPVEQRWWDPGRHRRLARFQLLVVDDGEPGHERACLVAVERRRWWVLAIYD